MIASFNRGYRGYQQTYRTCTRAADVVMRRYLDEGSKIVSARLGANRLRVAGTAEFNGYNRDIRAERIDPLINWCRAHFPGVSTRQSVPPAESMSPALRGRR